MTATRLLEEVVAALNDAGIPHMLVGSHASMSHGVPRFTQDIDIVIDPSQEALDSFVSSLDPDRIYVDSGAAREALRMRDQFNIIDFTSGWKVDLILRKGRPFDQCQFERRIHTRVLDVDVYVASAEDTILAKLEWAAMGGSERQVADAAGVLAVQGDSLDDDYLDRWAVELGVAELLERARKA